MFFSWLCVIAWTLYPWMFGSSKHLSVCINFIRRYIMSYTNWLYQTKDQSFFSLCKGTLHVHLGSRWPPLHPLVEILATGLHKTARIAITVDGTDGRRLEQFYLKRGRKESSMAWSMAMYLVEMLACVFPSSAMERLASLGSPCVFLRLMIRAKWAMDSQIIWFLKRRETRGQQ
jgi:hypothetical protein